MKKNITVTNVRRAVCVMANALVKTGLTLSEAFRKAWRRVKKSMTFRVAGVTFGNRQAILKWLSQFPAEQLTASLEREKDNAADENAVKIILHVEPLKKKACVGYVPRGLAHELSKVLDAGISYKVELVAILGGYGHKENFGALLNISI